MKRLNLPELQVSKENLPNLQFFKDFSTVNQLKTHVSQHHKELEKHEMEIDVNGQISYPDLTIEKAIFTPFIFSNFVHSVVLESGKQLERQLKKTSENDFFNKDDKRE